MRKKLFLLIKYLSKSLKISREDSACILLELFKDAKVFELSEKHQKIIIENIICYFQSLVFGIDVLGINKNMRNRHIKDTEIVEHLDNKIRDLVVNSNYLKLI